MPNISVYLKNTATWQKFKEACAKANKRPNSVLHAFIESFCDEVLEKEIPLERQIALAMIESGKIAKGEIKGKDARKILEEI
jgi:hypothetical protein